MNLAHFAHGAAEQTKQGINARTLWVVILVTLAAKVMMLGSFWLLKRYTAWNFPATNETIQHVKGKGVR